jgi:membrane-associated phospholipid phosphatase
MVFVLGNMAMLIGKSAVIAEHWRIIMNNKIRFRRLSVVVLYAVFYLATFYLLEQRKVPYHMIHTSLDDKIPFCEYFIVPYLLWFLFVLAAVCYFIFFNESEQEYRKLTATLMIGMTVFLVVSYLYPNGQNLRPVLTDDNIFCRIVMILYASDTPTNILPSLHVFNAVACCTALLNNASCRNHKILSGGIVLLTVLIVLSTMFLKQHSVIDVLIALSGNAVLAQVCYGKYALSLSSKTA